MRLTWLQLRTSSVASRLLISSGIALILLLARSRTFICFRFKSAVGNVEKLLCDKLTSLRCFNCWKLEGMDCKRLKERFRFSSLVILPMSSGSADILFLDRDKVFITFKFPMLE